MSSRTKNPPKTVQTKIRRIIKSYYKDRRIEIESPKFIGGILRIYIDGKDHFVHFIDADNRCKVELVRVWSIYENCTNDYFLFETGEKFVIPELTEEEKEERTKIYSEFFNSIYKTMHHE